MWKTALTRGCLGWEMRPWTALPNFLYLAQDPYPHGLGEAIRYAQALPSDPKILLLTIRSVSNHLGTTFLRYNIANTARVAGDYS